MGAELSVRHLGKYYGIKRAIEDVSFEVKPGEVVGLLGPNGAGKTTIMRILTCFFTPSQGEASVAGFDCVEQSMEVRRRVGYMPENPLLYHDMRVMDYFKFICGLRNLPRSRWGERLAAVTGQLDLGGVTSAIIGRLSKGFRQRVGLAAALIHDPEVVILDEPTVGLDPKQIREFRDFIKSLGGSKTVILSSHILPEVQQICERIVILNHGRIVTIDTKSELLGRLKGGGRLAVEMKGDRQRVIEKVSALKGVTGISGESGHDGRVSFTLECESGSDVREALFQLSVSEGWVLCELHTVGASLEEVFLQLTTTEGEA